jgi:hypothetical protein
MLGGREGIRQERQLSLSGGASPHSRCINAGVLLSDRPLILLCRIVVQYVCREHSCAQSGSTVRTGTANHERPSANTAEHGNICTQSACRRCDAPFDRFNQSTVMLRWAGRIRMDGRRTLQETDCMSGGHASGDTAMAMVTYRMDVLNAPGMLLRYRADRCHWLRPVLAMVRGVKGS